MFSVKRIVGIMCAKNCKNKFEFAEVMQENCGLLFQTRCTFGRRAFAVGGLMAWNSIPDNLRDPSLCSSSFRRRLTTVLSAIH